MTQERKNAIVDDIMALLIQLTDEETIQETSRKKPVEMLTFKECTQAGKRGKILINKEELLKVFEV